MREYWQKKPLLIRQAVPGMQAPLNRRQLLDLALREDVESRLIVRQAQSWSLRRGPFKRSSFPPFSQAAWTALIQGVDQLDDRVHALMQQFRFIPDARLDDVMISYATDQGGVGPHFDSYDVFLLQAQGRRRWRIGKQKKMDLVPGLPLKILADFQPTEVYDLDPGDMLYLPPRYAHDDLALGECMTCSIGFRTPARDELAREVLLRLADQAQDVLGDACYSDPQQAATAAPGQLPQAMLAFTQNAIERLLHDPQALASALGEYLSEPKAHVFFDAAQDHAQTDWSQQGIRLALATRMLYDDARIYINGEAFSAAGRDAQLMRLLCDQRSLDAKACQRLSSGAQGVVQQWLDDGWLIAAADKS